MPIIIIKKHAKIHLVQLFLNSKSLKSSFLLRVRKLFSFLFCRDSNNLLKGNERLQNKPKQRQNKSLSLINNIKVYNKNNVNR